VSEAAPKLLFITNPNAGPGDIEPGHLIVSAIGDRAEYVVQETERAGHATDLAAAAVGAYDVIVAMGGDGTVNEVGRGLVGTSTPMGIVPVGSGNALARALGISLELAHACRVLLSDKTRSIDVGRVDDEIFLSTAGIGIDAEVCWHFAKQIGGRRGLLPYLKHGLHTVANYEARPVLLSLNTHPDPIEVKPQLLTFANTNAFGYGAEIAPGAQPDDGELDVIVVEDMTLLKAALSVRRLFRGTFDRVRGVSRYQASEIRIDREAGGCYQVDGEAREGGSTLNVSLSPQSLRVVAPF